VLSVFVKRLEFLVKIVQKRQFFVFLHTCNGRFKIFKMVDLRGCNLGVPQRWFLVCKTHHKAHKNTKIDHKAMLKARLRKGG
jgi:hypothetical protein